MTENLSSIQASGLNGPRFPKSDTELARQVAAHLNWLFDTFNRSVHERDGTVIADSIEALAEAGHELGWFHIESRSIDWGSVHTHHHAKSADEVRQALARPDRQANVE